MLHFSYRKIDAIYCEMKCTFDKFNFEFLLQYRYVPYKYVIINSPKTDENDCIEYLHAHSKDGDVDRCLRLSTEEIHRIHRMSEWDCCLLMGRAEGGGILAGNLEKYYDFAV